MRENNKNKFDKINRRILLFVIFKFFSVTYIIERLYNLQNKQGDPIRWQLKIIIDPQKPYFPNEKIDFW